MPRPATLCPPAAALLALLACLAAAAAPAQAAGAVIGLQLTDAAGQPLPGAAVFLESKEARAAVRPGPLAEVVQAGKQFLPAVTLVTTGTAVAFPNRDTVRHHVYSFSPAKKFEIKLYVGTPAAPVVFDSPGIAALGCNIHDQMAAWVVVVDTPHHALTGADGRASFTGVPAGTHRLRAWHPALPPGAAALDQALQVPPTGALAVALKLPVAP